MCWPVGVSAYIILSFILVLLLTVYSAKMDILKNQKNLNNSTMDCQILRH